MLIVLTSVPNAAEGNRLANQIVDVRLAACVQILPQMLSVFVWEGEVQQETEHLLIMKTMPEKWEDLEEFISANHSYDVPEIIAVESEKVAEPYKKWISEAMSS